MVLNYHTQEQIDQAVLNGGVLGTLQNDDEFGQIPRRIGDWNLHTAPGQDGAISCIVAIPTNGRTRIIYNAGRKTWLKSLGYTDHMAERYIKASAQVQFRWEDSVARFVVQNEQMTTDTWYAIRNAPNIMLEAKKLKISHTLSRPRFIAAMSILMNLWELTH